MPYPLVALACSDVFATDYPKEVLLVSLSFTYVYSYFNLQYLPKMYTAL